MVKLGMDPTSGLAAAEVAKAYVAAVEGSYQGVILDPQPTWKIVAVKLCPCEVGGTHLLVK